MKRRKILKIVIFVLCAIYITLAVMLMVKMFPYFIVKIEYDPSTWFIKNWGFLGRYLCYIYFGIYCISTLLIAWLDLSEIIWGDGSTLLSVIWQIIVFVLLLIMYEGSFSQYVGIVYFGTHISMLPISLVLGMLSQDMGIFKWILFVVLFILALVLSIVLEGLACALIQKNLGCLFIYTDEKPTKSKNERSLKNDLSDAADLYVDMKNAENLQKTAEELEKIRYEISRRK